jgi:hypothetical protein
MVPVNRLLILAVYDTDIPILLVESLSITERWLKGFGGAASASANSKASC